MPSSDHRRATKASQKPCITPVFPLLLLETMRDMDRPEEVLEDEDVSASLPRRFGLSEVVGVQIRRFQDAADLGQLQSPSAVADLIRLVIRRPDAEEIFNEAGRRMARFAWEQRPRAIRRSLQLLPQSVARLSAQRAERRLFRRLVGDGALRTSRHSPELRISSCLAARADPGGAACAFYAGALAELMQQYTGRSYTAAHPHCEAKGAEFCGWTLHPAQ